MFKMFRAATSRAKTRRSPTTESQQSHSPTTEDAEPSRIPSISQSLHNFKPAVARLGSPFTVVLVYHRGSYQRKVLLGSQNLPAMALQTEANETFVAANRTVPRALSTGVEAEIERVCGETIFCIGSLVKQFVAATFLRLLCEGRLPGLSIDTSAVVAYNDSVSKNEPKISSPNRSPSLGKVISHYLAFAPADREIFSPDGDFIATDEELIEIVGDITFQWERSESRNKSYESSGWAYSNLNYGILALIMERKLKKRIYQILKDELLGPLSMTRTYLHGHRPEHILENDPNVAQGFRWSEIQKQFVAAPNHDLRRSTLGQVTVGCWSCANDLAKFYQAFIQPSGDDVGTSCINREVRKNFLATRVKIDDDEIAICAAGYSSHYPRQELGRDSLNRSFQTTDRWSHLRSKLVKKLVGKRKKEHLIFNKGGTADGFTSTMYLCPYEELFVITLCNSTSFIDLGEPLARSILLEILYGRSPEAVLLEIEKQEIPAREQWISLEKENIDRASWADDTSPFHGLYLKSTPGRTLEILGTRAIFRRKDEIIYSADIGAQGRHIRLFPRTDGLLISRVTDWRHLTWELRRDGTRTLLVGNAGAEEYVRQ